MPSQSTPVREMVRYTNAAISFWGLSGPVVFVLPMTTFKPKFVRIDLCGKIDCTSSQRNAAHTMTSTTQANARANTGCDSSSTVSSNDSKIATVYISAGRLGGLSAESSAVQDLMWPVHSGSLEICWSSGTRPKTSNMFRTTLNDSGTVFPQPSSTRNWM